MWQTWVRKLEKGDWDGWFGLVDRKTMSKKKKIRWKCVQRGMTDRKVCIYIASLTIRIRCKCMADITPAVTWVIYTIICLWTFAKCRSQVLLDCLGRCLKLIASSRGTSCHEFASHFGLEFVIREKTANQSRPITDRSAPPTVRTAQQFERPIITPGGDLCHNS